MILVHARSQCHSTQAKGCTLFCALQAYSNTPQQKLNATQPIGQSESGLKQQTAMCL